MLPFTSFEELIGFLRMKPTIAIAKACIHRILRLALLQSKIRPPDAADKINVRIFLAAYMIVCFPTNVFERIGPTEQALLDAARRMLETFEGICLAVHGADRPSVAQLPRPLMERLPGEVREYLDRFAAWRVPDEARLVGRIERALLAVLQARAEAGAGAAGLNAAELEGQAARLREKLAKLAGTDAVDRVEAAARASSVQLHA